MVSPAARMAGRKSSRIIKTTFLGRGSSAVCSALIVADKIKDEANSNQNQCIAAIELNVDGDILRDTLN